MAKEPAVDFGTFLRQAREKRGVTLQQVAATTKISVRVLESLEKNDPRKLPGGIFSRAFVRSYAREVGVDPEVAVELFVAAFPDQSTTESAPDTVASDDPEIFESRRRAATTFLQLLGISLIIVVIVVIYYSMRRTQPQPVRVAPETVQESRAAVPAPTAVPPPATEQAPPGTTLSEAGATTAPAGAPTGASAGNTGPAATSSPAQPPTAAPAATATDAPLTIEIAASGECWLVLTIDGARVIGRTLEPGEHVSYPVRSFVTVNAGNAGALSLTLNGKPAKPIGSSGQVVAATITPATFKNFLQQP